MNLFLHVTIDVNKSQEADFVEAMEAFLESRFLQDVHGWELAAGFKILEIDCEVKPDGTTQKDKGKTLNSPRFVNIWRLPVNFKTNDIAAIMIESSELRSYVTLDSFVVTEKQNVVYRVNDPFAPGDIPLPQNGDAFALVRHYIARPNLAEFVFATGSIAGTWERQKAKQGWRFRGTFQNITGLLNEFWDVWQLSEPKSLDAFRAELTTLAGAKDDLTASLRHAVEFDNGFGIDDGLLILEPARYWRRQ